jgi:hypothetical protein
MVSDVVRFDVKHFQALEFNPNPGSRAFFRLPNQRELLATAARHPSYTLMINDRVVACAGVVVLWPGVGEAWAFVSKDISSCKVCFFRAALEVLSRIERDQQLHRVQAVVHEDHPAGQRFAWHLGFRPEGELHRYGSDKSNFIMYARLC